jgi:hypothetical protein
MFIEKLTKNEIRNFLHSAIIINNPNDVKIENRTIKLIEDEKLGKGCQVSDDYFVTRADQLGAKWTTTIKLFDFEVEGRYAGYVSSDEKPTSQGLQAYLSGRFGKEYDDALKLYNAEKKEEPNSSKVQAIVDKMIGKEEGNVKLCDMVEKDSYTP